MQETPEATRNMFVMMQCTPDVLDKL